MNIQLLIMVFSFVMVCTSVVVAMYNSLERIKGKSGWHIVLIVSITILIYGLLNGGHLW